MNLLRGLVGVYFLMDKSSGELQVSYFVMNDFGDIIPIDPAVAILFIESDM